MEPHIPTDSVRPKANKLVPALAVVIPVYNEEQCIIPVLEEWTQALRKENIAGLFVVVDDCSTDHTWERIENYIRQEGRDDILALHQANQGHGQSCLNGYRKALELKIPRIFQIDSDGQCDPAFFPLIWAARDQAVAIYGRREQRGDGWSRVFISWVLKEFLHLVMKTRLSDSNVPFRLYQSSTLEDVLPRIPRTFHLANIAVALLLEPRGFVEIPIHFRGRQGGQSSVGWLGFVRKALQLHHDLKQLGTPSR